MAITLHDATGEDTQSEFRQSKSRDRDETQRHLDGRVAQVKAEWEGKGKPKPERSPFYRFTVAKADRAAAKQMVRRAVSLHKVDVIFWKDTPADESGNVTVKFTVTSKPVKTSTNEQAETKPQIEAKPQASSSSQKSGFLKR